MVGAMHMRCGWLVVLVGLGASCIGSGSQSDDASYEGTAASLVATDQQLTGAQLPPRRLALTYDDGPGRNTLAIAQYLRGQGVPATFFQNGCRFQGMPAPIAQGHQTCKPPDQEVSARVSTSVMTTLIGLGHRVANHTEDHANLVNLLGATSTAEVQSQVQLTQGLLESVVQDQLFLLRPPHNAWTTAVADAINATTPQLIGPFLFDVVPTQHDFACLDQHAPTYCAQLVLDAIGTGAGKVDHGIIQLHDRESDAELAGAATGTTETLDLTTFLVNDLRSQGYVFVPLDAIPGVLGPRRVAYPALFTSHYSDSLNWAANASYYQSIRLGDLDGDGDADICGRGTNGLWCATSNHAAFVGQKFWLTSNFKDSDGWLPEKYGTTIQLGDIDGDGDADVCGRGTIGLWCAKSRGAQGIQDFTASSVWSQPGDFSDADGWDAAASYYGSFRLADVDGDGDADACARGIAGIWCALSNGVNAFGTMTLWIGSDFSDAKNWLPAHYGTTIMFGDLDGDGRDDVCGRGTFGIRCARSNPRANAFLASSMWLPARFSDQDEWNTSPGKYRSLHLADVNGDGRADVCGRNDTGIACAFSTGASFTGYIHLRNDKYNDLDGWAPARYGTTIQLGDVDADGLADVCGRGIAGIWCSKAAEALRAP
jgi:peptidoglycan/xylan/chitin deacetylase (PgdA/CDA1 family)